MFRVDFCLTKKSNQSFILFTVLRQRVLGVGGAHLHVIAPAGTAPFEEMSQQPKLLAALFWLAQGLNLWALSRDERVTSRLICQ